MKLRIHCKKLPVDINDRLYEVSKGGSRHLPQLIDCKFFLYDLHGLPFYLMPKDPAIPILYQVDQGQNIKGFTRSDLTLAADE